MSCELPLTDALVHVGRPDLAKTASSRAEAYTFESRDATTVSFVQALIKNANAETVATCREHGRFWGISKQLSDVEQKLATYQPENVADTQFALVAEFEGQPVRKYAAHDRQSVAIAARQFYDDRASYPLAWRKTAAARLIGRAERFATVLPDYVETYLYKAAGLGYPTPETLETAYIQRDQMLGVEGREEMAKLGELISVMSSRKDLQQDEEFVKAAIDALADIDQHFGLVDHYANGGVGLPEDILADTLVLPALQKQAAAICRLINGHELNLTKLSAEVLNAIDPQLTKLSAHELAEVLPTLPKGDADMLVRLAKHGADAAQTLPAADELPAEGELNNSPGELADTDMAAGPISTEAEAMPSMPTAESASAPMDMPTTPAAAAPTTGTPAVQPAPGNTFTDAAGLPPMNALGQWPTVDTAPAPAAAAPQAPLDAPPAPEPAAAPAPAAPADPNTFTDATADQMAAAPPVDNMSEGTPLAAPARDPRETLSIPAAPGAGGAALAANLASDRAGRPRSYVTGGP